MQRLIIPVVVLAAVALGWLALSRPEVPDPSQSGTVLDPTQPRAGADAKATPGTRAEAAASQKAPAPVTIAGSLSPSPPMPPVVQGAGSNARKWGRAADQGVANVRPTDLKSTVRRYYGNLPRSGQVPARVEVQEVLPPDLVRGLNVPPESELLWLGERPISDVKSFEAVLAIADDGRKMVGVTVRTPDGLEMRDYVEVRP
jgi:hypothetical protein